LAHRLGLARYLAHHVDYPLRFAVGVEESRGTRQQSFPFLPLRGPHLSGARQPVASEAIMVTGPALRLNAQR